MAAAGVDMEERVMWTMEKIGLVAGALNISNANSSVIERLVHGEHA